MAEKFIRMTSWVTPKQKAQVKKWAKILTKKEGRKVSESEIIRTAIDKS
jgi:hypothetical protein